MKIDLSKGASAVVDQADFIWLNHWKWSLHSGGYAVRRVNQEDGSYKMIYMHRLIMGVRKGEQIDHANGDPLDNRRENLRLSTQQQNRQNSRLRADNSSGFKGVYFHKINRNWCAYIRKNGKKHHIGCFDEPISAALAYDEVACEIFGEFALTNL